LTEDCGSVSTVPAVALIAPGGWVRHSTDAFRARYASDKLPATQRPVLERVLSGQSDRGLVDVDGPGALLEAVTDARGARLALLTLAQDKSVYGVANALLAAPLDESPAILYLKDLDGRYLRVNRRYQECFGIEEDRLLGFTDRELQPSQTIDGPRLRDEPPPANEPLQLEYIVAGFENRPPLAALRFAVRDRGGVPIGVCGVAAPLVDARVARAECTRLMQIERWSRMEPGEVRSELVDEWGVVPVRADPAVPETFHDGRSDGLSAQLTAERARAGQLEETLAGLQGELEALKAARSDREDEVQAAREQAAGLERALTQALQRADDLTAELRAERERAGQLEEMAAAIRSRVDGLAVDRDGELQAAREEATRLIAQLTAERKRAGQLEDTVAGLRSEVNELRGGALDQDAELQAAREEAARLTAQLTATQTELEAANSHAARAEQERDQIANRLDDLTAELSAERERAGQLENTVTGLRSEVDELQGGASDHVHEQAEALAQAQRDVEHAVMRTVALEREVEHWTERAELESAAAHVAEEETAAANALVAQLREQLRETRAQLELHAERVLETTPPVHTTRWSPTAQRNFCAALAGASDWRLGLKDVVKVIGSQGGWDAAIVWSPERRDVLKCAAMWVADHQLNAFETFTWQRLQPVGTGELGTALAAPGATWIRELDTGQGGVLGTAAAHGLRSALLVPIRDGVNPIALLELLTRDSMVPDPELEISLEAVGLQLGQFAHLLREGATPHWRLGRL